MPDQDPYLKPKDYVSLIKRQPAFQEVYDGDQPRTPEEIVGVRRFAVRMGAIAAADHLRQQNGEHNLDAYVMAIIAQLDGFFDSQKSIAAYTDRFGHLPKSQVPTHATEQLNKDKRRIIEFNHTLRGVIEACSGKFNFNELLVFMTNIHIGINGPDTKQQFYEKARETLFGIRNEVAAEKIALLYGDYDEVEPGSVDDDKSGGDIIINGTPIDLKTSRLATLHAQERAAMQGRNPNLIVWTHIDPQDYMGGFDLPDTECAKAARWLIPDIDAAITSHRRPSTRALRAQ